MKPKANKLNISFDANTIAMVIKKKLKNDLVFSVKEFFIDEI